LDKNYPKTTERTDFPLAGRFVYIHNSMEKQYNVYACIIRSLGGSVSIKPSKDNVSMTLISKSESSYPNEIESSYFLQFI
jgi:hypothetical protein